VVLAVLAFAAPLLLAGGTGAQEPPARLQETGLYSDFAALEVDPRHLRFAPQYPLWTDGAVKRRWISLPPGTAIDASDPEAWVFPVGTRLWKEFSFGGRRVETRMLERMPDGGWRYAAYEWSADGREATLAPERGRRGAFPLAGGRSHTIPAASDCRVCHEASPTAVLGFSLLQLSPDRDPGAPHAEPGSGVDLGHLVEAGLLVGLPPDIAARPPRIEGTPIARAALGYLHGNCGHCHNSGGKLKNVELFLRHLAGAAVEPGVASTVGRPVREPAPGQSPEAVLRVEPGHPERSAVVERMGSRWAALQMPPLGSELVDAEALALVRQWIADLDEATAEAEREDEKDEHES
jgi:hypothetical protein